MQNASVDETAELNERITELCLKDQREIDARIRALSDERDVDQFLETVCGGLALAGIVGAALSRRRRWLVLSGVSLAPLLLYGIARPRTAPQLRRLGLRTRWEIDCEKFALKALRGDFDDLTLRADERVRADVATSAATAD
jgi:hypothetical protein